MSKDKESRSVFDGTVLGLASLLHDEAFAVEQLSVRLDRLRFRAKIVPPLLLATGVMTASMFMYMIVRTTDSRFDAVLEGMMAGVVALILYTVVYVHRASLRRIDALEGELDRSVSVLRELTEKVAQFEEYRGLPAVEKFVVELRLRTADKVISSGLRMLGKLPRRSTES